MKTIFSLFSMVIPILAFSMEYSNLKQDIDRTLQITDTISTRKTLNDIRFKDWDRSDWLDNEYIRTLRKYLDDYNKGIVSNTNLDPSRINVKT